MLTLGINAVFHDSAACVVRDGRVVAAAEEERFTRIKHGKRPLPFTTWELPFHAIDYCLAEAGASLEDVDHVAYSYDPQILLAEQAKDERIALPLQPSAYPTKQSWTSPWEPLALAYIMNAERQLLDGAPHHVRKRFLGARARRHWQWHYVEHHLAHEASAFLAAPFDESAVMTIDGRGELATTTYGQFSQTREGARFERLGEVRMPHSLGLLYEQVTDYLGFLHSSDEYKVMALASYGSPLYVSEFREMVRLGADGQYEIRDVNLAERFGPARSRGAELTRRHFDIARSLQWVLEETAVELASYLRNATGSPNLCMAGGVALNCVMNARIRDAGLFERVWVQPAAGDAGTALGAALWADWQARRSAQGGAPSGDPGGARRWQMDHAFWGPSFSDEEIEAFLKRSRLKYRRMENVALETAAVLAGDRIVGWFQGRMEFGPRALGARSILASPLSADMQQRLNEIKDREDFRPVAPVVLEEEASRWFASATGHEAASIRSPFMLFVYDVAPDKAARIPAVRHVDGTARVQTIDRAQNPLYYDLLKAFQQRTGVPVLVNTSFNTRSEPVVCSPRDAVECFWTSPIDALAIGSFLLEK
ncbi:MAG TPA: carbamoyltransferase C-terminal domain-containing protein [Burkholderiales bacterium]|nr:carbamoyltransferase C-terminal domain-containing protein [Burkholderiales bacterium]